MKARLLILFLLAAVLCFSQNTAKFPAATATMQDLAIAKDAPNRSVLTSAIDSTTLSVPVSDGTKFSQYNIVAFADTMEQAMICSVSVNTLTLCSRGFGGSTATIHGNGIGVIGNIVAWHHNQLAAEIKAIEEALGINMANVASNVNWSTLPGHPTALSAFTNDVGFITAVPAQTWASITGKPTLLSQFTNDPGFISAVPAQTWASITSKPAWATGAGAPGTFLRLADVGCLAAWQGQSCDNNSNGIIDSADYATTSGDAATVGTYTPAKIANAFSHDASWTWQDNYLALPTGTSYIQWGVFSPQSAAVTITKVSCSADVASTVIQLRNSNGSDFITSNLTCGTGTAWASTTTLTVNAAISTSQSVGMYAVSGTAKRIAVVVSFTTSY